MHANSERLTIDELAVYCAWRILARKQQCTFEKLTVECYRRFPERFSLQGYPEYPDSARVNKSWLRCRTDHGWLLGNLKSSFRLSPEGLAVAKSVRSRLSTGPFRAKNLQRARERTRESALVAFVRGHPSFKRYLSSKKSFTPSRNELLALASCTLDTPPRVVNQNLIQLLHAARLIADKEVESFLRRCLKWSKRKPTRRRLA